MSYLPLTFWQKSLQSGWYQICVDGEATNVKGILCFGTPSLKKVTDQKCNALDKNIAVLSQ